MNEQSTPVGPGTVPSEQFRTSQLMQWSSSVPTSRRKLLLFAVVVLVGVFGFGGYWASTAEIGGAVVGSGRVVAAGNNRIVQHLEGGILEEIFVKVGDLVQAGDPLASLDTSQVESQHAAAQIQRAILATELERWRAESAGVEEFVVNPELLEPVADNPRVQEALASQQAEFSASLDVMGKQFAIFESRIQSEEKEIQSQQAVIDGLDEQEALIKMEHKDLADLLEQGLTARPRVLALERVMSQITAQRSTAEYSIEQAESLIKSYNEEMQKIGLEYTEKANQNVSRLQRELNALEDVESRLANRLQRSVIRAPSDGIVFRVYKTTEGSVLGAGESFAEIFPDQDELNVEVLVQPRYISSVEPGQDVNLVFQSDHRANLVPLEGTVEYISTDTIVDETTGVASYVVHVSIRKGQEDRRVLPGNIAEAFFSTEPKTLVELVTEPLTRFAFRSFKG